MSKSRHNDELLKALKEFDQCAKEIFQAENPSGSIYDSDKPYPDKDFTKACNFLSGKSLQPISNFEELDQGVKESHFSGVRDFIKEESRKGFVNFAKKSPKYEKMFAQYNKLQAAYFAWKEINLQNPSLDKKTVLDKKDTVTELVDKVTQLKNSLARLADDSSFDSKELAGVYVLKINRILENKKQGTLTCEMIQDLLNCHRFFSATFRNLETKYPLPGNLLNQIDAVFSRYQQTNTGNYSVTQVYKGSGAVSSGAQDDKVTKVGVQLTQKGPAPK